ncbi:metabotropic glutamate receptor 4 [Biomphalaria pfeifferi]|uniref:Metabotropic glutamate receptor 4 n=1 Tax=Biomphalaria pfeifferi TaxID=112525 RepID=A0AAD8F8P3_BIOPF|nr:metabotropic glutamate receptor 4 [Biomphalaria pfeifferi]
MYVLPAEDGSLLQLILLIGSCSVSLSCSDFDMPDLNNEAYVLKGDINIGALYSITDYGEGLKCNKKLRPESWVIQFVEATVFAIEFVNNSTDILPNLKLGLAMMDYCRTTNTALAKALSFLPKPQQDSCAPQSSSANASSSNQHYDVVGVVGTFTSSATVYVSYLYSVAKMPLLGFITTSDELSSKAIHPYFLRVVPPDKFQVLAMLTFIAKNGWSFISLLYEKGSYGEKAYDNFKLYSSNFGICLAATIMVDPTSDYDKVVGNLLDYPRARVVIIFTGADNAAKVLMSASIHKGPGHFVWIGSDGLSDKLIYIRELAQQLIGSFVFMFYSKEVPAFSEYFKNLSVNKSANPWLKQYWEMQGKCSFDNGTCGAYKNPTEFSGFKFSTTVSLILDSVLTYAHALHNLLEDLCPNVTGSDVRGCIKREVLLRYMFNSSFNGFTGNIQFNPEGDVLGKYEIRQVSVIGLAVGQRFEVNGTAGSMVEIPIAAYEITCGEIKYNNNSVTWGHLNKEDKLINRTDIDPEIPESVCSRSCSKFEYKIQREITCCWECASCRSNEKIVNNGTGCEACPEFTWPNENLTSCSVIPPVFASPSDTLSLIEICLASVAMAGEFLIVVAYIKHRETRVIKASSRELSALQLLGILSGYVTVIVLQIKPSHEACNVVYFIFCLSFAWLYSPLLVKAIRIYRIFESSAKFNLRPRFVSPKSQIVFVFILIFIQVIICIFIHVFYTPTARKRQPVLTEKFVELSCDMTLPGLISFLVYNLFLVTLCSIFAFKTRKLPENFNESRFITMCVSTALIIWLSFIATYFTATKDNVRVLLLSMTLLINHTVALVFLFLPKIYAAVYVDGMETESNRGSMLRHVGSMNSSFSATALSISNRVTPLPRLSTISQSTTT